MPKFEKIKKKYALNNSYFKNRLPNMPKDPFEVWEYYLEHGELPYNYGEMKDDWFYECFIEYQKRAGVTNSQFFTPPKTAERIAEIVYEFTDCDEDDKIWDACCGFGQITSALHGKGYENIEAFDFDAQMVSACIDLTGAVAKCFDFKHDRDLSIVLDGGRPKLIVSNPPYEVKDLTEFLGFIIRHSRINGVSVLLLPQNFIDKQSPKRLVQNLEQFEVIHREPMTEPFARTNTKGEIVVLKRR